MLGVSVNGRKVPIDTFQGELVHPPSPFLLCLGVEQGFFLHRVSVAGSFYKSLASLLCNGVK